eukprot:scaffold1.g5469.t1
MGRGSRSPERHRDRERKHKSRGRSRSAERRREGRGGRSRSRSKDRHRDKRSRSHSRDREERKRSKREDGGSKREEEAARHEAALAAAAAAPLDLDLGAARAQALAGHDAEEARRLAREAEQAELDAEMEKRRKRIEAWQEQRRKLQAAEEVEQRAAEEAEAAAKQKAWTLEDEESEPEEEEEGAGEEQGEGPGDGQPDGAGGAAAEGAGAAGAAAPPPPTRAGDDEEEEEDALDAFMTQNAKSLGRGRGGAAARKAAAPPAAAPAPGPPPGGAQAMEIEPAPAEEEEEEEDPLDAFMAAEVLPEVQQLGGGGEAAGGGGEGPAGAPAAPAPAANGEAAAPAEPAGEATSKRSKPAGRPSSVAGRRRPPSRNRSIYDSSSSSEGGSDSEEEKEEKEEDDAEWARKLQAGKLSKGDKLVAVDHSALAYTPFRRAAELEFGTLCSVVCVRQGGRNFYIEVPELARMTAAEVEEYRKQLDGIKAGVRGKDVPKPIKNWHQAGLSSRVLEVLRKSGFDRPLPIQAQAVPTIMGGRDCIAVAKTGSGKTLAFVLPMIRHVKDQPPLAQGDGMIGLVMAPTRELVTQIAKEVKRFARNVGLTCVAVYGGSGVANQISELKRGAEVVVCTPGRMIDILVTSGGKITNLRRVTYLVLDEADRMFDMGFEPQIMRVVQNVRPDRQTVMFSATFPRQVEVLAKQVLVNPVEILVGGRSVVNKDITQYIEIRPEEERFLRLLEVLGEWYEKGKLLIFVSSQDRCDTLFRDLLRAGYPCLSLHGGKDQSDRESTISDFKQNVCNVLVATSVAARGLDVKDLVLVVNYDCPNHHEDYVHRVGRTGRAGAKGFAITFIGPEEEHYAPDLIKALKESGAPVPADLAALAAGFEAKRKAGLAKHHASGYGGSGFKFNTEEDNLVRALKKATAKETAKEMGMGGEEEESEDEGTTAALALVRTKVKEDEIREVITTDKQRPAAVAPVPAAPGRPPAPPVPPGLPPLLAAVAAEKLKIAQAARKADEEKRAAAMAAQQKAYAEAQAKLAAVAGVVPPPAPGALPAPPAAPPAPVVPLPAASGPIPGVIPASAYAEAQAKAQQQQQAPAAGAAPAAGEAAGAAPEAPEPASPVPPDLSSLPPEVQARIKAAQVVAEKLAQHSAAAQQAALSAAVSAAPPAAASAAPAAATPAALQPAAAGAANPILAAAQMAAQQMSMRAGMASLLAAQQQQQHQAAAALQMQQQQAAMLQMQQLAAAQHAAAMQARFGAGAAPASVADAARAVAASMQPLGMPPLPPGALPPGWPPAALPPGMLPSQMAAAKPPEPTRHFETELEINDFPQKARWKVTHRDLIRDIGEMGAAIIVKGRYYRPGTAPGPNEERKLYLEIQGPTVDVVKKAKAEVKRIIEEATESAMRKDTPAMGRYSVV